MPLADASRRGMTSHVAVMTVHVAVMTLRAAMMTLHGRV
jgi:hypothetical protein